MRVQVQKGLRIDLDAINPAINRRRPIVPFAELLSVFGAKELLPPFNEKLRMRCSNEQRLRVRPFKQLFSPPGRGTQDSIDNPSPLLGGDGNRLMHGSVFRGFENEDLVQPEPQDVANVVLDMRSAQAIDPKIEQS